MSTALAPVFPGLNRELICCCCSTGCERNSWGRSSLVVFLASALEWSPSCVGRMVFRELTVAFHYFLNSNCGHVASHSNFVKRETVDSKGASLGVGLQITIPELNVGHLLIVAFSTTAEVRCTVYSITRDYSVLQTMKF